jgi:hypothetical protein
MEATKKTAVPLPDGWEPDGEEAAEILAQVAEKRDRLLAATLRFDRLFTDRVSDYVGKYLERAGNS